MIVCATANGPNVSNLVARTNGDTVASPLELLPTGMALSMIGTRSARTVSETDINQNCLLNGTAVMAIFGKDHCDQSEAVHFAITAALKSAPN